MKISTHHMIVILLAIWLASATHAVVVDSVSFTGPAGVTLTGVRYRPDSYVQGSGYSAVVLMHGCSGIWSSKNPGSTNGNGTPNLQNHIEKWGLKLAEQGIVALVVDSFTPRKPVEADPVEWQDHCSGSQYADTVDSYTTRVLDARAGWDYLDADNKIDDTHIALLGWSHGAQASMVEAGETEKDTDVARAANDHRFVTTVVFYPGCGSNLGFGGVANSYWRPHRDTLIQMGDLDSFHDNCQTRFSRAVSVYSSSGNSGHDAIFTSHTDASHSFDAGSQAWPTVYCNNQPPTGDTCAMNKADIESLAFLQARLVDNDGDGVWDANDAFPVDGAEWLDTDLDGIGNNADWDDDGDGVPDVVDAEPLNNANASEISLPLDNNYKGFQLQQQNTQ